MAFRFFFMALISLLTACGNGSSSETSSSAARPPVDEDDLLGRLSYDLVSAPVNQAEIDRNTIVNYAINEMLDVRATTSGLYYQIVETGDTSSLATRWGDVATVAYRGTFLDGRVFDESAPGKPLQVKLGQVIAGWQEAIPMLHEGGKGVFLIPSELAYGPKGFGKNIPPNTVLKFEITLLEVARY